MQLISPGKHDPDWHANVTCGQQTGSGCGAVLRVVHDDLFTVREVFDERNDVEVVVCLCPSCGESVRVGTPGRFGTLPDAEAWAKLHQEDIRTAKAGLRRCDTALGIKRGITTY